MNNVKKGILKTLKRKVDKKDVLKVMTFKSYTYNIYIMGYKDGYNYMKRS